MTTEHVVTLKVDTSLLFEAIKRMGGNCSPLGERLASVLLSTGSLRETIGLLGVYGIEIEDASALAAANERLARLEVVAKAAVRFRDDATGSQESLNALWDALDAQSTAGRAREMAG